MKIKSFLMAMLFLGSIGLAFENGITKCHALEADGAEINSTETVATHEGASVETEGFKASSLMDGDTNTYSKTSKETSITVGREDGIGFLYIKFDRVPKAWTMTDVTGQIWQCGQHGFLHEYVAVEGLPQSLTLTFPADTVIADIYVFSEGEIPDWVQTWQPPCNQADLLLVSSHSDDEQLFFAGVLPYYAGELGYEVQVAYVVQHFSVGKSQNHKRPHEQLDGLWTVGVRNYPVMSEFPDLYAESKDRQTAFEQAEAVFEQYGYGYEDFVAYITEIFRRFKPLVVVSHDLDGEYGHGTHVLCAAAITEAVETAKDETLFAESAKEYGTWAVEKVYLHLYEENQVVMNWDIPLDSFGGKTAFEVTRDGFDCHKSQHWTWFYRWIYGKEGRPITKATDIKSYSPCKYGLYYTSVGLDETGGDFFEHVQTYTEREKHLTETRHYIKKATYEQLMKAMDTVREHIRAR